MFIWLPPTEAPDSRPAPSKESENPPSVSDFFALPDSGPLRAIRDFAGIPLRWVQTDAIGLLGSRLKFELRCGEEILGLVRYQGVERGRPQALARTKQGTWSFRGRSIEVAIETDNGDRTLVRPYGQRRSFNSHLTPYHNPTLSLPNGHDYFLKKWGFWTTDHRWLAADDTALVTFRVRHQGFLMWSSIWGEVEVHPPAAALSELDLLITLGLYLALTPPVGGGGGP